MTPCVPKHSSYIILQVIIILSLPCCHTKNEQKPVSNTITPNDSVSYVANFLEEIGAEDQILRRLLSCARETFGRNSAEMQTLYNVIDKTDSLNLIEVSKIINKYGWLGISEAGAEANKAQWLVIQHASLEMQEKYLPLMKRSFDIGESKGSHLALLEDRILMRKGEKQLYGSQIKMDMQTGKYFVYPIKDSLNVDKRRAEMGMEPLADYLSNYNITY